MRKLLYIICLLASSVFAGTYTTVESGVSIYSEYYPNTTSKFKGTIIFENAMGFSLGEWTNNQAFFQCAKKYGSLFFYDRNGLGMSPPDLNLSRKNPITGELINRKLLKLLRQNKIKPPYILVSNSYGALLSGYFALKNPRFVQGLLMVDPMPKMYSYNYQIIKGVEPLVRAAKSRSAASMYQNYSGVQAEIDIMLGFERTKKDIARFGDISDKIPIIIVSSGIVGRDNPYTQDDWFDGQKQWLNGHSKSRIFQVDAGHFIQLDMPEIICNQIRDLIAN